MSHYNIINAKELSSVDPKKAIVIDVRTKMEHGEKRLKISHQNIVIDKANPENFAQECNFDKDAEIYVLCGGGGRAKIAAFQLASQGYRNVSVIEGGIVACENCGLEIEGSEMTKPAYCLSRKASISLERQVRIAAGLFVFIGSVLALILDSSFALIPLFVGAGLIFAGVTNQCGLALILTKAPWNKVKK